jgi:hypothetical protein
MTTVESLEAALSEAVVSAFSAGVKRLRTVATTNLPIVYRR